MSNSPLLTHYAGEKARLEGQIDALTSLAFTRDDKHLSEQDLEQLSFLKGEMDKLNRSIEGATLVDDLSESARRALLNGQVRGAVDAHEYKSRRDEGQAVWDYFHRDDAYASGRIARATEQYRAAEHMGTQASQTTAVAGGFDGLYVSGTVGPIITTFPEDTPFLTALGPRVAPSPGSFQRPRIVDPYLLDGTGSGPQAGGKQKGELPSKHFDIASDLVNMATVGSYLNLSLQAETWIPGSFDLVVAQLRRRTSWGLEKAVVTEADKTAEIVAPGTDAAGMQAAVWDAMSRVFVNTGSPPTLMVAGPTGLANLGSTVDLAGRPLFPVLGPNNALGGADGFRVIQPFGLVLAVSPAITDDSLYVMNRDGLEVYVHWWGSLQAVEPSILGRQIAVAAAAGFFHMTTAEAGPANTPPAEYNAIVKIGT